MTGRGEGIVGLFGINLQRLMFVLVVGDGRWIGSFYNEGSFRCWLKGKEIPHVKRRYWDSAKVVYVCVTLCHDAPQQGKKSSFRPY